MKTVHQNGAELFHSDGRTYVTMVTVAFRISANANNTSFSNRITDVFTKDEVFSVRYQLDMQV